MQKLGGSQNSLPSKVEKPAANILMDGKCNKTFPHEALYQRTIQNRPSNENKIRGIEIMNEKEFRYAVELTCAKCGEKVSVAKCSCDRDANLLIAIYHRDILAYDIRCPYCKGRYESDDVISREVL